MFWLRGEAPWILPPVWLRRLFALCFSPVADDSRQKNALLVAASLIAAVRTAKEEKIDHSRRIIYKVSESVQLAKMVLTRIEREEEGI